MKKFDKPRGQLFTSNPAGLKYLEEQAELWQITRAGVEIPNTLLVKQLSPSKELFLRFVKHWKGSSSKEWWPKYEELFLQELENEESIQCLREIYKRLLIGKNIVLICFCDDHRYCHRRLVADFFRQFHIEPIELNPIKSEQLPLFK
ncbi:DUF488 family protein [Alkalihalobacillus pseudalcaliphilus]|uniref:DUF488 family protein, N3 subclade n=1 Tax=Alkalihalobacillus pseudalcaliphilus TaxID=79884 RepID=UPI00064DA4E8|nr:DUF488 family protein [Alkalihalobacillus pseudalcaliphilus]KMK77367.1 hypothetical protein AB990_02460 [Alkalihalobacillus pseudalcaliphilus]